MRIWTEGTESILQLVLYLQTSKRHLLRNSDSLPVRLTAFWFFLKLWLRFHRPEGHGSCSALPMKERRKQNSEFNSEHDTHQNWICEGFFFSFFCDVSNRENRKCPWDWERENTGQKWLMERKKGMWESGRERKTVRQRDRGATDWTEDGQHVPSSLWCPHSVPPAFLPLPAAKHVTLNTLIK